MTPLQGRLDALLKELKQQGKTDEDLDELVQDAASEIASAVNNEGVEAQVKFLLNNGWTTEDILGRLKIQEEEEEDKS